MISVTAWASRRRAELVEEGGSGGKGGVAAAQQLLQAFHKFAGRGARARARGFRPIWPAFGSRRRRSWPSRRRPRRTAANASGSTTATAKPAGVETAVSRPVELACRLHHHARDLVGLKTTLQSLYALGIVGERVSQTERMNVDVESSLYRRRCRRRLALRLVRAKPCLACGTCSPSSVQDSREGQTDQAHPRFASQGVHDPARPTARGWPPPGGHPEA